MAFSLSFLQRFSTFRRSVAFTDLAPPPTNCSRENPCAPTHNAQRLAHYRASEAMADQNPELVMQQVQSELANAYAQEFFTVSARETPPL
jgi:hypothetical protein